MILFLQFEREVMLNFKSFKNPVVFFANGIGDHLMALPAIRALSKIFNGQISLIALPNAHSEIFSDITFKAVWSIVFTDGSHTNWKSGVPEDDSVPFDYKSLVEQVKECDLFLALTPWYTPELEALIGELRPTVSVGPIPGCYDYQLNDRQENAFDVAFSVVHLFVPGYELEDFSHPPSIPEKEHNLVSTLKVSLEGDYRLLTVHADTKKRKMLGSDRLLKAIDAFLDRYPNFLVGVIGLWNDLPLNLAVNHDRMFNLCGLTLDLTFGIIGISDIFLGVDSCMLHVADLYRVPSVGIFGPTDPKKWGVRFSSHKYIFTTQLDNMLEQHIVEALGQII